MIDKWTILSCFVYCGLAVHYIYVCVIVCIQKARLTLQSNEFCPLNRHAWMHNLSSCFTWATSKLFPVWASVSPPWMLTSAEAVRTYVCWESWGGEQSRWLYACISVNILMIDVHMYSMINNTKTYTPDILGSKRIVHQYVWRWTQWLIR